MSRAEALVVAEARVLADGVSIRRGDVLDEVRGLLESMAPTDDPAAVAAGARVHEAVLYYAAGAAGLAAALHELAGVREALSGGQS